MNKLKQQVSFIVNDYCDNRIKYNFDLPVEIQRIEGKQNSVDCYEWLYAGTAVVLEV